MPGSPLPARTARCGSGLRPWHTRPGARPGHCVRQCAPRRERVTVFGKHHSASESVSDRYHRLILELRCRLDREPFGRAAWAELACSRLSDPYLHQALLAFRTYFGTHRIRQAADLRKLPLTPGSSSGRLPGWMSGRADPAAGRPLGHGCCGWPCERRRVSRTRQDLRGRHGYSFVPVSATVECSRRCRSLGTFPCPPGW